jgi:hypothetical protein
MVALAHREISVQSSVKIHERIEVKRQGMEEFYKQRKLCPHKNRKLLSHLSFLLTMSGLSRKDQ